MYAVGVPFSIFLAISARSPSDGPAGCILRNLYSENTFPCCPTARFTNNTGPLESILIKTATSSQSGIKTTSISNARRKSKERLQARKNGRAVSAAASSSSLSWTSCASACEEVRGGMADMFKLLLSHLRENRERKDFVSNLLGYRKIAPLVTQTSEGRL